MRSGGRGEEHERSPEAWLLEAFPLKASGSDIAQSVTGSQVQQHLGRELEL